MLGALFFIFRSLGTDEAFRNMRTMRIAIWSIWKLIHVCCTLVWPVFSTRWDQRKWGDNQTTNSFAQPRPVDPNQQPGPQRGHWWRKWSRQKCARVVAESISRLMGGKKTLIFDVQFISFPWIPHFSHGFRRFSYCGPRVVSWSDQPQGGFFVGALGWPTGPAEVETSEWDQNQEYW